MFGLFVSMFFVLFVFYNNTNEVPKNTPIKNSEIVSEIPIFETIEPPEIIFPHIDTNCKTPKLTKQEVEEIIIKTKTTDLNFVALAESESHLNNHAKNNNLLGIFQVNKTFHEMDDYCDPAQQVIWLERKIREGAKVSSLFPSTYNSLYSN